MSEFSSIPQLNDKITQFIPEIADLGVTLLFRKEIPYGAQFFCEGASQEGKVTFYYSKKKGLNAVDNSKNELTGFVADCFLGKKRESLSNPDEKVLFRPRIGSDEAGKGDLFGPLTAAAFFIETEEMERDLLEIGIRDSKKLTDKKIHKMAEVIREKWPNHCEVLSPPVETYNNLYSSLGNLNKLLGWMHGRIIADLSLRFFKENKIEAVVDRFAHESHVTTSVAGLERVSIIAITHGEDAELAVAAASVLARDRYVSIMNEMNDMYDMKIYLGCGAKVKECAIKFQSKFGRAKLDTVIKTHFKTAKEVYNH